MRLIRGSSIAIPAVSLMLLTACAGDSHLTDVDPVNGAPRLVVSDVAVSVTDYLGAVSPAGGRVTKQNILGWVVMSRPDYKRLLDSSTGRVSDTIFDVYARECRQDKRLDGCDHAAALKVQEMMK